jgi:hypothetical protein
MPARDVGELVLVGRLGFRPARHPMARTLPGLDSVTLATGAVTMGC